MNKNVNQRILKYVRRHTAVDSEEINLNTNLSELDLDSLDQVELIMDMEKEFDIAIDDEDAEKLMTREKLTVIDIRKFLSDKYGVIDIKAERKEKITKINEES